MTSSIDTLIRCDGWTTQSSVKDSATPQVERDRLWTFEQPQNLAFTNVHTTIRMTVIRLRSGGLFVYSPVAPTACGLCLY